MLFRSVVVSEPQVVVVRHPDAAADEAARRIAIVLRDAVARRGRAHWAVTGGSTAVGIYRAPRRTDVDLLAEAIESGRRDPVAVEALRAAAMIAGPRAGAS